MKNVQKCVALVACMMMGTSLLAGCSSSENGNIRSSAAEETRGSVDMEEQAVEEEVSEETGMSEDEWRVAYAKYLESADCPCNDTENFYLIYVNDDDIPELYQDLTYMAEGGHLIYFENGEAKECNIFRGALELIERSGNFGFSSTVTGGWCEAWYVYDGSVLEEKFIGQYANADLYNPPENITWNDEEVSKEQYLENLCQVIPEEYQNEVIGDDSWLLYDVLDTSKETTDWYGDEKAVAAGKQAMIDWLMDGVSDEYKEAMANDWAGIYLSYITGNKISTDITQSWSYTVCDMNGDEIPEVVVHSEEYYGEYDACLAVCDGAVEHLICYDVANYSVYYDGADGYIYRDTESGGISVIYRIGENGFEAYMPSENVPAEESELSDWTESTGIVSENIHGLSEEEFDALLSDCQSSAQKADMGNAMSYDEFVAYLQEQ